MLINLTNHPSNQWPAIQLEKAIQLFQNVKDIPFPQIPPDIENALLNEMVDEYLQIILELKPIAVHIMGELTFTFRLVNKLTSIGIPCIASTTERIVSEDGKGNKTSTFKFVQFRDY